MIGHGRKLLRSSGAATASQVWRVGVTLATHMVLRRLLPEEDWGLWQWAADFLFLLLGQIRDLGLPAHVVRVRDQPYGTFLKIELIWGAALGLAVLLAAPLLAGLNADPHPFAIPLVRALVLFLIFEGLAKVPLTFFEAELLIDRALVPELARNLCFAVVSIALAVRGAGVYSLLVGHVAASAVFAAALWWRAWGAMPLRDPVRGAGELGRLLCRSVPLMVMAFVLLAVDWTDLQLVTARFSIAMVGLYGAALRLAQLVSVVLEMPLRRALFPSFVAVRDDPERFFETYRLATVLLMVLHAAVAGLLFVNAETVLVLYGGRDYAAAAGFLRLLCLAPLVQPFARCAEDVLLSRHEERILIVASILNLAALVGFGWLFSGVLGAAGVALAKLLPAGSLIVTWAVWRVDRRAFGRLLGDLAGVYGVAFVLFAGVELVPGAGWRLVLSALAAGVFLALAWRFHQRAFRRFFQADDKGR